MKTTQKYFSQMGEDRFVDQHVFNEKTNGVFVDVGAHDGITFSNTYFLEKNRGWSGICIEPLPSVFQKLTLNRTAKAINACAGLNQTTQKFLQVSGTGNAEMFSGLVGFYDSRQLKYLNKELKKRSGKVKIINVKTIPLSQILEDNKIQHINYLSIDTEGSELEVLKSINFDKCKIDCLTVENLYGNDSLQKFLENKEFELIETLEFDQVYLHQSFPNSDKGTKWREESQEHEKLLTKLSQTELEVNQLKDELNIIKDSKFFIFWKIYCGMKEVVKKATS